MNTISKNYLEAVGKKARRQYEKGEISERRIMQMYAQNKAEADSWEAYGYTLQELSRMAKETHNPLLRLKIEKSIEDWKERSAKSKEQNALSLEKLAHFKESSLGIGLRRVIKQLFRLANRTHDEQAYTLAMLLSTEFSNLSAKRPNRPNKRIYARKDYLIESLRDWADKAGLRCGYNFATGKNASYLVFFYLPNGVQLTWHTNNFEVSRMYPLITDQWDGQVCMNLEKLVTFVESHYTLDPSKRIVACPNQQPCLLKQAV